MNLAEIKKAVINGKKVHWTNKGYQVIQDQNGEFVVKYLPNNHIVGLETRSTGELIGDPNDFYIRLDLSKTGANVFYKYIYPVMAKDFLYGNDLNEFLVKVDHHFELNDLQVAEITNEWNTKEFILS